MTQDAQIIELIIKRDETGISKLHAKYSAALYGIVLRTVKHEGIAQEVLQETFLKVWNKILLYDSEKGRLFTWLSAIARNTAIDQIRLKKYSDEKSTQEELLVVNAEVRMQNSAIDTNALLKHLDAKHEIVLRKAYLEGYSQSEIAKELTIPLGTVKTRIRNGILELRTVLKNEKSLFLGMLAILLLLNFFIS